MNIAEYLSKQQDVKIPRKITPKVLSNVMSDNGTSIIHVLQVMGCNPRFKNNGWIEARCPNHINHAGHHSQHDNKFNIAPNGYTLCFTSGHKSNIIEVLAEAWNVNIQEAIKRLYNKNYVECSPIITQIHEKAKRENNEEALKKRLKLVKYQIEHGKLDDDCIQFFANDGILHDTLDFLGITSINHGVLEGRAIIPFLSDLQTVCGYVAVNYKGKQWWIDNQYQKCLKIDNSTTRENIEKNYKKAIYCTGFSSANHLYGLWEVLNGGQDVEELVLVQGERDAIKLLQQGIDAVSIHGTSLKDEQLKMLTNMPKLKKIYIGLDMDEAGRTGCEKIKNKLMPYFSEVKILEFPNGKDPKKFNRNELMQIIKN